jgi:hypothetical protein
MSNVLSATGTSKHQAPSTQAYLSPNLSVGTISTPIGRSQHWYSAMHGFWPLKELAKLADGPTGCRDVPRGGCLFACNFSEKRSSVFTAAKTLDQTRPCRCIRALLNSTVSKLHSPETMHCTIAAQLYEARLLKGEQCSLPPLTVLYPNKSCHVL